MGQYVKRKRRKKRKLKSSFIVFSIISIILITAIILFSANYIFTGDGDSSSSSSGASTSSQETSSETSSAPLNLPESSNISVFNSSESAPANADVVSNKFICEIISWEAETFTKQDTSDPNNTPLPVGTVDYCSGNVVGNGKPYSQYKESVMLRYGKRVFYNSLHIQRSKIYDTATYGELPETNNVNILKSGISSDGRYSILKLDVDWKAPFELNVAPQAYNNVATRDYTVSSVTSTYVDITFKYSSKTVTDDIKNFDFGGTIFKNAEWKKNVSDYTLRLYLNKIGGFYGWHAEYDSQGNLVFYFLNPAKVNQTANGINLNGAKIYLDIGHGGKDPGASGTVNSQKYDESDLNLSLGKEVEKYLAAMGATVIMSRNDDSHTESHISMQKVRDAKPDFVLSIHHNSGGATMRGMDAYHYYPFSSKAAGFVKNATSSANIYSNVGNVKWHVYYVGRVGYCPSVLTENGYISNSSDLSIAIDPEKNKTRAKALADGVVEYFKYINGIN